MRKVFLDELPRKNNGDKENYDWKNALNYIVNFQYDDYYGCVKIIDYNKDRQGLVIEYNDNQFFINTDSFLKCLFAHIIGLVTYDFRYNVGDTINDEKRNITIVSRERKVSGNESKYYHYKCNNCGWNFGYNTETNINKGAGCSCCSGHTVVEGINDIPTVAPWMIKYFRGGVKEARQYTSCSERKINPICPECGRIKKNEISIVNINKSNSIGCVCSDGISYPEKFIHELLNQINIYFISQFSVKDNPWCKNYRYDFGVPNVSCIIESHGNGHYETDFSGTGGKTLIEEQENDRLKEQLAKQNGIENYIVLDCRKSELEWIKKSVLESNLLNILNFTEDNINWLKCHEFACSNLIKIICEYKKLNNNLSTTEIGKTFKLTSDTIRKYLKQGTLLGWCNYDAKTGREIGYKKAIASISKKVEIFKDGISLGFFNSATELSRKSEEIYGVNLHLSGISNVCCYREETYKGFTFKFKD